MPKYSLYVRERIVSLAKSFRPNKIVRILESEGFAVTERGIYYLLKRYSVTGSLYDAPRSGRPPILDESACDVIDTLLQYGIHKVYTCTYMYMYVHSPIRSGYTCHLVYMYHVNAKTLWKCYT